MTTTMNPFGEQLRQHRLAGGYTLRGLATLAGCDPTYLTRIEEGHRGAPGRQIVERLAQVLPLEDRVGRDLFFAAAGLLPPGGWLPELTMVRDILVHPRMSERGRLRFRQGMEDLLRAILRLPTPTVEIGSYIPLHERVLAGTNGV